MDNYREVTLNKIAGLREVSEGLTRVIASYESVLVWWHESTQSQLRKEYIEPLLKSQREVDLEITYLKEALEGDRSARK